MNLAPIVLFVYNRPWHTKQTLNALMKNELADKSVLYIYADGPRVNESKKKVIDIKKVRELIKSKQWCKKVYVIESDENKGLSNSVIEGVSKIVNNYGKIIVLEDDIITSNKFLHFMNHVLNFYENEEKVMSVAGYSFPVKNKLPDTFFLRGGTSPWGWGTWSRAWKYFNPNAKKLYNQLSKDKQLQKKFNFNNSYNYMQMLKNDIDGKIDSWGIRWYASVFLKNGLGLYPGKSLVNNIGFDNTGTHCSSIDVYKNRKLASVISVDLIKLKENKKGRKAFERFYRKNNLSFFQKIKNIIKKILFYAN